MPVLATSLSLLPAASLHLGCLSLWTEFPGLAYLNLTYVYATASPFLLIGWGSLGFAHVNLPDPPSPVTCGLTWDMSVPLQPGLALGFNPLSFHRATCH